MSFDLRGLVRPIAARPIARPPPRFDGVSLARAAPQDDHHDFFMARRLLVVDDEQDIREAVAEALGDEGFVVETARDGRQALEKAAGARVFEAILLDLMMPGMDGWTFRELQRRDPELAQIPVIVVSASAPEGVDADAVLAKPFHLEDLLRTVRDVLERRGPAAPPPAPASA